MIKNLFRSHPVFFAVLLMFITLVPVMCMRDVSPSNELRYLSITDEAILNGDVFTFSNQGADYADKPPLYFWLFMLSRLIFGEHCIFVLSLFSFIPAMVIIAVMDKWLMLAAGLTSLKFSPGERFAAAIMTGTCIMYLGTAVVLRMDMLMCMFIVLSLFTFYKMFKGIGSLAANRFLLPFYIFMALFSKGPVGLLMPLVCIFFFLLLMGRIKEVGRYLGWRTWLVLILFSGAWFLGVWLEGGSEYLNNLLFHQTIDRAVDATYHKEPFWFYIPALFYTLAPFSLLLVLNLFKSFRPKGFVTDAERLISISIVVTFIMLSAFSSKLSIYLAPIFPLMTYLFIFVNKRDSWNLGMAVTLWIPALIFCIVGVAVAVVPFLAGPEAGQGSSLEAELVGSLGAGQGDVLGASPEASLGAGQGDVLGASPEASHGAGQGDVLGASPEASHGAGQGDVLGASPEASHGAGQVSVLDSLKGYDFLRSPFLFLIAAVLLGCNLMAIFSLIKKSWTRAVSFIGLSLLLTVTAASPLLPELNSYIGYGNLCEKALEVSENEHLTGYYTLCVSRPENMDVYLGEDIISFGNDIDAFLSSGINDGVLIVKMSAVADSEALKEALYGVRSSGSASSSMATSDAGSASSDARSSATVSSGGASSGSVASGTALSDAVSSSDASSGAVASGTALSDAVSSSGASSGSVASGTALSDAVSSSDASSGTLLSGRERAKAGDYGIFSLGGFSANKSPVSATH